MDATIVPEVQKHYPVLLKEIISVITPQHGGTFIDCTFGQGGYTKEILKFKDTKVISLDRDNNCQIIVEKIKKNFPNRFIFKNLQFSKLNNLKLKNENIKGIVFDLGYSYSQIKDQKKGLSFHSTGKLNMMMGLNSFSANEVINNLEDKDLEKILKYFGDERDAKAISKNICRIRLSKKIDTQDLVNIIEKSKRKKHYKTHSATKTFQALRIFVNKEITELITGIINATKVLKPGGKILIISFHSIEDKIVKYFFSSFSSNRSKPSRYFPENNNDKNNITLFDEYKNKILTPSLEEIIKNPPSRSAKLRYAIRSKDIFFYPQSLVTKFKKYLDLESSNV